MDKIEKKLKVRTKEIVLIEDNEVQRNYMERLINDFSTDILISSIKDSNGFVDKLLIDKNRFDAILTDYDYRDFEDIEISSIDDGVELLRILKEKHGKFDFPVCIYSQVNNEYKDQLKDLFPDEHNQIHQIPKDYVSSPEKEECFAGLFTFLNSVTPQYIYFLYEIDDFEKLHFSKLIIALRRFLSYRTVNVEFLPTENISNEIAVKVLRQDLPNDQIMVRRKVAFREREFRKIPNSNLRFKIKDGKIQEITFNQEIKIDLKHVNTIENSVFTNNRMIVIIHSFASNVLVDFKKGIKLEPSLIPNFHEYTDYFLTMITQGLYQNNKPNDIRQDIDSICQDLELPKLEEFYFGEVIKYENGNCHVNLRSLINARKRRPKVRYLKEDEFLKKNIPAESYFFLYVICNKFENKTSIVEPALLSER